MSKFNPREHRPLWLEDSGLTTSEIEEAVAPAAALLEAEGLTPEEAHAEMLALIELDDDAARDCAWFRAEREITANLRESAVMALG